jgi:hypothetical protein
VTAPRAIRHQPLTPKETIVKFSLLSIPDDLYARLKDAAAAERRTVANEILCLIERGLAPGEPGVIVMSNHEARPGVPVLVITELSDLRGPAGGKVVLPSRLFPDAAGAVIDLDEPALLAEVYQTVLSDAAGAQDLAAHLNGPRLIEAWPGLFLPDGVRLAWEEVHPVLAAARERG